MPRLGSIPAHWSFQKFRYVFRESHEKIETAVVGPMLSVSGYRGIEVKEYDDENRRRSDEDLVGYRIVRPGQLVVNTMWMNYAGLGVSDHDGHVSPAYRAYFISDVIDGRFAHHLMRSGVYVTAYTRLLTGVRPNSLQMSRDDLMAFPVLLPPRREQVAIADFLDRETAKIDALVAEQERLIELLQEKRQAVISHAVTKGLNPDVPMKDSGVEWIGEIPEHWELTRLRHLSPRISGRLVYQPAQYFTDEGVPFLMGNNITEDGVRWEDAKLIPPTVNEEFSRHALREGDVVTVRVGAPGVTCVVPREADGLNCGSLMIVRRDPRFDSYWLASVMNSRIVRSQIDLVQYGAAQEQINITAAVNFLVPAPPLAEQRQIAAVAQERIASFRAMTDAAALVVALLNERRSALISAAVTGQIDVRGASARRAH